MQPVKGIADRAFWTADAGQPTIFSNSHMYIFSASSKGSTDQEKLDLAKKFATAVLAKAPPNPSRRCVLPECFFYIPQETTDRANYRFFLIFYTSHCHRLQKLYSKTGCLILL